MPGALKVTMRCHTLYNVQEMPRPKDNYMIHCRLPTSPTTTCCHNLRCREDKSKPATLEKHLEMPRDLWADPHPELCSGDAKAQGELYDKPFGFLLLLLQLVVTTGDTGNLKKTYPWRNTRALKVTINCPVTIYCFLNISTRISCWNCTKICNIILINNFSPASPKASKSLNCIEKKKRRKKLRTVRDV